MIATQLIQREPNKFLVNWMTEIIRNGAGDLPGCAASVTPVPNQSRRLVQAMRQIALKIVNESFVWQGLYYQPFPSGSRFG